MTTDKNIIKSIILTIQEKYQHLESYNLIYELHNQYEYDVGILCIFF